MIEEYELKDISVLLDKIPSWLTDDNDLQNLSLISRIKLIRNIEGFPFPHKASKKQLHEIMYKINGVILSSMLKDEFKFINFTKLPMSDVAVLSERGFISKKSYASSEIPAGLWINEKQDIMIVINNGDHLKILCFDPVRNLKRLYEQAYKIEDTFRNNLEYMTSEELGLLTSSPVDTGTGCKFSVLTTLPGVSYHEEGYRKITRLLEKRKMTFKPLNDEADALFESEFFVISNKTSLNIFIDKIIESINFSIDRIQGYEESTLEFFFDKDISFIEDKIYEAASRFKYCRNISYDEFLDRFTYIILAYKRGYLNFKNISRLKSLLVKLKDNHLEYSADVIGSKDVDILRADKLREIFKNII